MLGSGDGPRGVVVFALSIAFNLVSTMTETAIGLRLDNLYRLVIFRSLPGVSHVSSRRNFGENSSGKGNKQLSL